MDPETYWEKRCNIDEQILQHLMRIAIRGFPQFAAEEVCDLGNSWNKALDELDEEFTDSSE